MVILFLLNGHRHHMYIYIYVFIYLFTNVCFLMLLNGRVVVTIWLLHVIKPYIIFTICMVTS
jgi:hypothetical protein